MAPQIAAVLASVPTLALGCALPEPPPGWRDLPISVAADCSYSEAGDTFDIDVSGGPAFDLGNGLVAQGIDRVAACDAREELVVVDCTTRAAIGVQGVSYGDSLRGGTSVKMLYPPKGKIRLNAKTSVAGLASTAQKASYTYWLDVEARAKATKPRNRANPYCGCRLFYPDSDGAK